MGDGCWVILDDELAPQGYAYLLVMNGCVTVKSCMFSGFKQEHVHVQRTVAAFQRLVGLEMMNPRPIVHPVEECIRKNYKLVMFLSAIR